MPRLIDTNAIKFPNIAIFDMKLHGVTVPMVRLIDLQMLMPTIDAAPVVHGQWVMDECPHDGDVRCSACHIAIDQMHERNHGLLNALTGGKWRTFYHYCPNCGAKMDLEETS